MTSKPRLLLAGGDTDPQMVRLLKRAALHGIPVHSLLTGQSGSPRLHWDIRQNRLFDDGEEVVISAAFIRQDVFLYLKSQQAQDSSAAREWFVTVSGWLLSSPDIVLCNRRFLPCGGVNKPYVLRLALDMGFAVADSYVSNDVLAMNALHDSGQWITKPVTGGAYCTPLEYHAHQGHTMLSYPQIIQHRLAQPELRIFRVGKEWFGFRVISAALDYRSAIDTRMEVVVPPADLVEKMGILSDHLGLTFAAADFKTDERTGELQFLEINTNPMFAGFDQIAAGALSDAILRHLGVLTTE
jgi:hypothetical protein